MMSSELPAHLHATRDLLMRSLPAHLDEMAPPAPGALVSDLSNRFLRRETQPAAAAPSWLVALRSLLATPGFGVAAAAVLLLGVAVPTMLSPTEQFRGAAASENLTSPATARILLVGDLPAVRSVIVDSGFFDSTSITGSISLVDALNEPGPRIIVDASEGLIRAFGPDGSEIHAIAMPEDPADIPALISRLVTRL